ncbi:MAG: DUF4167 domain-containing protein, partial [Rhodospirillaceae bacterium]|nr:DUF4167 domain-containing protein [Rhodospirillaceae bacterium]
MNKNQNQNKNRSRGRNNNNRRGPSRGNNFESNGPEVKVRGTAQQVLDKYLQLARDAQSSGDRINAEGYLQYAEHYFRVINADDSKPKTQPQHQPQHQSQPQPQSDASAVAPKESDKAVVDGDDGGAPAEKKK